MLERGPHAVRIGDAQHGGERDALLGAELAGEDLRDDLAAEGGIVESRARTPSELASTRPSGTRSSSTARAVTPPPARASVSASSAGWKSLSARKPTTQTGPPARRSPRAIVSGTTAEGRGTPTAVGSSRFSSIEPV